MKAFRFHGKGDLRLEDIDEPKCGDDQVKEIKPAFCGICGTDLHEYLHGASLMPTTPHGITNEMVPLTIGHEFSGVVEEIGSQISDVKVGERVCVQPIIYDGTCVACKEGAINCCEQNGFIGLSGWGGGLSEHVVVPRKAVYKLPDSVTLELGALVEPLSVAWHAVDMSPFKEGDSVLVLGGGPIGLALVQALKARKAGQIIVSEVASRRKDFAAQFGANHVLDPTKDDIVARVRELCDGAGAHVAFDAAGVQTGLEQAVLAIRARGTLVNVAIWAKPASIIPNQFVFRERRYIGVATFVQGDFQNVIDAIASGRLKPADMITRKIKLEEVEEKGYKALAYDKDNHVKILVDLSSL